MVHNRLIEYYNYCMYCTRTIYCRCRYYTSELFGCNFYHDVPII